MLLGYKLHKHIAKALSAHSQEIHTSLGRYNDAAAAMFPPHVCLSWENIVEHTFLINFNLLQDTHQDIHQWPWAQPAARLAMDQFHK
ncbi:hypothetical protein BYT27DRAFT_7089368, partial [Phlegmacium glaucopus]